MTLPVYFYFMVSTPAFSVWFRVLLPDKPNVGDRVDIFEYIFEVMNADLCFRVSPLWKGWYIWGGTLNLKYEDYIAFVNEMRQLGDLFCPVVSPSHDSKILAWEDLK